MLRVGLAVVVVVVAVAVVLRVAVAAASLFSLSFSLACLILPDFSRAPLVKWPSVFSIPSSVFKCFCVKLLYCRSVFKEKLQKRSTVA